MNEDAVYSKFIFIIRLKKLKIIIH